MMSDYPDIKMPSFRCEPDSQKDSMTLHYYSFRDGMQMLVAGKIIMCALSFCLFMIHPLLSVLPRTCNQYFFGNVFSGTTFRVMFTNSAEITILLEFNFYSSRIV